MTNKRCLAATVAVFGILVVTCFLIHGLMLKEAYQATASLWRPMEDMKSFMWMWWVLYLVNALILPYFYSKGYESGKSPLGQGLRFGLAVGLLLSTGMSLGTYLMIAMPASLALIWFSTGMIQYTIIGIVIALIHQPKAA